MFKSKLLLASLCFAIGSSTQVYAQNTGLQDLQSLPTSSQAIVDTSKAFSNQHWAYKTLENISRKYGLMYGKPGETFDGTKPLTRNQAAVMLVNLTGKIEQDRTEISEAEKVQLEILRQELSQEITALTGRVATLETSVDKLQGSVTKLQKSDSSTWKGDFGKNFKINSGIQVRYNGNITKGADYASQSSNFNIPLSDITVSSNITDHIKFSTSIFPMRMGGPTPSSRGLLGDAYLSTDIIPNHNIYLGQTRVPIGSEGSQSPYTLETIDRAQISRNFADFRDTGIKVAGNYPFIEYFAGVFNGSKDNTKDINNETDYATWVQIKPFFKHPALGELVLGGGYDYGKNAFAYHNTTGFMAGYKYKKYAIKSEWSRMNGYLATSTSRGKSAEGFYVHNSYFLTKKLQLIGRFDQFDPNNNVAKNLIREYTIGANYYFLNQNLKLVLDLVHVDNQAASDSNRIEVLTQYKL